jgi:hypothetical protein
MGQMAGRFCSHLAPRRPQHELPHRFQRVVRLDIITGVRTTCTSHVQNEMRSKQGRVAIDVKGKEEYVYL